MRRRIPLCEAGARRVFAEAVRGDRRSIGLPTAAPYGKAVIPMRTRTKDPCETRKAAGRCLAGFVALALVFCLLSPGTAWKAWGYKADGVTVNNPGNLRIQYKDVGLDADGNNWHTRYYTINAKGKTDGTVQAYCIVPDKVDPTDADSMTIRRVTSQTILDKSNLNATTAATFEKVLYYGDPQDEAGSASFWKAQNSWLESLVKDSDDIDHYYWRGTYTTKIYVDSKASSTDSAGSVSGFTYAQAFKTVIVHLALAKLYSGTSEAYGDSDGDRAVGADAIAIVNKLISYAKSQTLPSGDADAKLSGTSGTMSLAAPLSGLSSLGTGVYSTSNLPTAAQYKEAKLRTQVATWTSDNEDNLLSVTVPSGWTLYEETTTGLVAHSAGTKANLHPTSASGYTGRFALESNQAVASDKAPTAFSALSLTADGVEVKGWVADANASNQDLGFMSIDSSESSFTFTSTPLQPDYMKVNKESGNTGITDGNPLYKSLAAQFSILTENDEEIGTIATDSSGAGTSGPLYYPGALHLKETKAAENYALNTDSFPAQNLALDTKSTTEEETVPELPQNATVSLLLAKKDNETQEQGALGGASLEGAVFCVRYYADSTNMTEEECENATPLRTWNFTTGEDGSFNLQEALPSQISGDELYTNSEGARCLPVGTYTIQETTPPAGYLLDSTVHVRHVTQSGTVETVQTYAEEEGDDPITDQVKRGEVKFTKKDSSSSVLAGIPFSITLLNSEGEELETHKVVTDENGEFDSSNYTDAEDVNPNDQATDPQDMNPYARIWFGAGSTQAVAENDPQLGGFPFGTYKLEELPCDANRSRQLISTTFTLNEHCNGKVRDLGTLTDQDISITTTAHGGDGESKTIAAGTQATVTDTVEMTNLSAGTSYVLKGTLMSKETGTALENADGTQVSAQTTFTAQGSATSKDTQELSFTFDASALDGNTKLVVFERLYAEGSEDEGQEVAVHEDLDNASQTVKVSQPQIGTTATDKSDGDHVVAEKENATIVDKVSYEGLVPGSKYSLTGVLMDKASGKALEVDGKQITATLEFTPEASSGSVSVAFTFPTLGLSGKKLVAFELLALVTADGNTTVASHEDINDTAQTVAVSSDETTSSVIGASSSESDGGSAYGKTGASTIPYLAASFLLAAAGTALIAGRRPKRKVSAATAPLWTDIPRSRREQLRNRARRLTKVR